MQNAPVNDGGVLVQYNNTILGGWKSTGNPLIDKKKNGKDRNWDKRKAEAEKLAKSYARVGLEKRSVNVKLCANFLGMNECADCEDKTLVSAKFCHDPLCPVCNWRRSLVLQAQIFDIFDVLSNEQRFNKVLGGKVEYEEYEYISLTLTVRNVFGGQALSDTIKEMHRAFSNMTKLRAFKVFGGYIRTTEVTRNNDKWSEWYGSYHPHIHVLLAVPKDMYFYTAHYLNKDQWIKMWRDVAGLDYDPSVDVQAVKAKVKGQSYHAAVVETAKYAVKSADYLHNDYKVTDTVVSDLLVGLKGVQRIGWGGIFRKVRSALRQVDVESKDVDLVGADGDNGGKCTKCGGDVVKVMYAWDYKLKGYYEVEDVYAGVAGDYLQARLE